MIILLSSCGTINNVIEKGGKLIDGTAFAFKTVSVWRNADVDKFELQFITKKDGGEGIVFTTTYFPCLAFYGSEPDDKGNFLITNMHYLGGNYGGWNEFSAETTGGGSFIIDADGNGIFSVKNKITLGGITEGKIRRENTRLTGDVALEALKNRSERIQYLTGWMKTYAAAQALPQFKNQQTFEKYWRPVLLPKKKSEYAAAPDLPEEMQTLYDSGALEVDWEEAAAWIYLDYSWSVLDEVLHNEVVLTKIK